MKHRSQSPPSLTWKCPRTETTAVARRRIWESRCGRFRVVRSRYLYGRLPDVWYACILDQSNGRTFWAILSKHRRRKPAFAACQRACRRGSTTSVCCLR